jgi:hypothetical protein
MLGPGKKRDDDGMDGDLWILYRELVDKIQIA